jgi:hypothetical protein
VVRVGCRARLATLPTALKAGGALCAHIWRVSILRTFLMPKYWVRPFTRRMTPDRLCARVQRWVDFMSPLPNHIRRMLKGNGINWRLLVADYSPLRLKGQILKEWTYPDTFDMLAPRYDRPATRKTLQRWGRKANLAEIDAHFTSHGVVMRARAPRKP